MRDPEHSCALENCAWIWKHIDHRADLAAFFNARALTSDGPIAYRIFGSDGSGLFPRTSRIVDSLVAVDGGFAYSKDPRRARNA